MKTVNPHFLSVLLGPLIGQADDEEAVIRFRSFQSNDKAALKQVIREELVGYYQSLPAEVKDRCKLALRYYLTVGKIDFSRIIDSNLLPFDAPSDSKSFFRFLWDELFPNELPETDSPEPFTEVDDIDEPNRYFPN